MNCMCDDENSRPIHVLVTGVGAIIGYGIIKSLRKSGLPVHIVGMDIYADAVGQHWCDEFLQARLAADPHYITFLLDVIHSRRIDLVFFGTEQEIYRADSARNELGGELRKLVLNRPEILALSKDKWATREFLLTHGLEDMAIPSVIKGEYDRIAEAFGPEFLLKPRSSYASKGIVKVTDAEAFAFYKKRMGRNFMAQKLVGDAAHEYTVAAFCLGDGTYSGQIAMRRVLSQEGATAKAEVVHDPQLAEDVDRLCRALRPVGPTNFQFRCDGGRYLLLEVNPRISSATSIRTAFGYNEALMCVRYFLENRVTAPVLRDGRATRFIDEVITD